jgi:hypothetical protein
MKGFEAYEVKARKRSWVDMGICLILRTWHVVQDTTTTWVFCKLGGLKSAMIVQSMTTITKCRRREI